MNTPKKGKLLIASQGTGLDDPWDFERKRKFPCQYSRLRWGDLDGQEGIELVIAPLFD